MRNPPVFGARVVGRDAVAVSHGTLSVLYIDATAVAFFDQTGNKLYLPADVTPAERRTVNKWARERGFGTTRQGVEIARADVEWYAKAGGMAPSTRDNPHGRRRGRSRGRRRNPEGGGVVFDEPGCYIDGAMGEDQALDKMHNLLKDVDDAHGAATVAARKLIEELERWPLKGDVPAQEWLDDATEVLQSVTREGLVWDWEAGDLCLVEESELE